MKAGSFHFPGKVSQVETENRHVKTHVLEYTKTRLFHKNRLLTFWEFRKPQVLPSVTDVTIQVTGLRLQPQERRAQMSQLRMGFIVSAMHSPPWTFSLSEMPVLLKGVGTIRDVYVILLKTKEAKLILFLNSILSYLFLVYPASHLMFYVLSLPMSPTIMRQHTHS